MLPGKTYTPEDIVRLILRRKWLLLIPLVLGTGIAVAVGKNMSDQYRSETLIMIIPQRIPDSYVRSTVVGGLEERLTTLNEQILSRSRLERVILDFNLYPQLRRLIPMEDVVQRMRGDIKTRVDGRESFRVSYVGGDSKTVQKVTARLASLFIEENTRDRENLAADTNEFLDTQLDDARRRLIEQEKKLQEYRQSHSGELPSQSTANLQVIQNAQMQIQNLADAEDRDRERRLLLERQLADLETPDPFELAAAAAPTNPGASGLGDLETAGTTAQQLEAAQAQLRSRQLRLKPDHPDIKYLQRTIRNLQAKLELETAQAAQKPAEKPRITPAELSRQRKIKDLREQMADLDRQLREKQEQVQRVRAVVGEYQARLDALPRRESELVELTRDYDTLQRSYSELLSKREESKLALNLERRNIGEQFRVLDPAKEAERPFSPDRPFINLIGAASGLALGVLLVGFLEYRDSTFKSEADIVRVLNLPVLALVPTVPSENRRQIEGRLAS